LYNVGECNIIWEIIVMRKRKYMKIEEYIEQIEGREPDVGGGNSKGYLFDDVILLSGRYDKEQKDHIISKMKEAKKLGVSLCEILEYKISEESNKQYKKGFMLQERAVGRPVHESVPGSKRNSVKTPEERAKLNEECVAKNLQEYDVLKDVPEEQYSKFIQDWITLKTLRNKC